MEKQSLKEFKEKSYIDIIQEIRIIKHPSIKRNHMFIRTIIAICLISLSVALYGYNSA